MNRWFDLLVETILPGFESSTDLSLVTEGLPAATALAIKASILIHEASALALHRRHLDALSDVERLAVIERIATSDSYALRQLSVLLKTAASLSRAKTSVLRTAVARA